MRRCLTSLTTRLAFVAAMLVAASASAQTARDSLATRVDALFADVNNTASPGCALGVIRGGALVYARGYGIANLDEDIALSPSSTFYIASTSKQFTAASILLLAAEGKLSLDDDVRKYIPELPDYGTPITIRNLLNHTSGIRDYLGLLALGAGRAENVMSDDDIIALITRQKALNFKPGSEYSYSNSGYFLLGQIVKRVTGTSLAAYAEARVFRPLGMIHTHFHDNHLETIHRRVIGYDQARSGFAIDYYGNFQGVGDGGLWTTVEDLALWDRNFYNPVVGGPALLQQQLVRGRLTNGDTLTYASGLILGRYRGLATVSHGGAFMGYRTELLRFPAQRFSVICLCNLSRMNPSALAKKVADVFLSSEFPQAVAADGARTEFRVELAAATLEALAGVYRNPQTGLVVPITVTSGRLTAAPFGAPVALTAMDATHFRSESGPVPVDIVFEPAAAGRAPRLRLTIGDDGSKPDMLERIPPLSIPPARLAEYAGDYWSEELRATYRVQVVGDSLTVTIANQPPLTLSPTVHDAFVAPGAALTFVRDAQRRITSAVLWVAQDRNIRFQRRDQRTT
jgi:CubicO group peptidase (beta-lactamase class C family)